MASDDKLLQWWNGLKKHSAPMLRRTAGAAS